MVLQRYRENIRTWWSRGLYERLAPVNCDEEQSEKTRAGTQRRFSTIAWIIASYLAIFVFVLSLSQAAIRSKPSGNDKPACTKPAIRREWRALTQTEKTNFIQAINCLGTIPTRWRPNGTLYDDFAFLHGGIGRWSHRSASFLPWHRYTLFVWQNALRDECGFTGEIPYWDWSLDWMNLAKSSIWDSETGFGGDGDPDGPVTVGKGRCVTDGPFTGLRPIMYNHTYVEHCISRGFWDGEKTGYLPSHQFRPELIGHLLRYKTYGDFVKWVEFAFHNTFHTAIRGDFLALTAANDPIFFLYHAQLDHLWWRWQQQDRGKRLHQYNGKHMYNSTGAASTSDFLLVGGFVEDIPVSQVMDTEGGFLCYRYA